MPFSCHSHSGQFCKHAYCSLEEIVERAIQLNFTHYGLTEHMPRYSERDLYEEELQANMTTDGLLVTFMNYVTEARRLQGKYNGNVDITVAMETDFIDHSMICKARQLRSDLELDYLVGSIHHVSGIPIDVSLEKYLEAEVACGGLEKLVTEYFDQQYELMVELKPEVIGHFDLISKYNPSLEYSQAVWRRIRRNIEYGVNYGALFEVNTSGMSVSRHAGYPYPGPVVLKEMVNSGAKITISDDSHGTDDVGWCYSALPSYLASNEVTSIHYLESCTNSNGQIIPGKVHIEKLENFVQHPFWKSLQMKHVI